MTYRNLLLTVTPRLTETLKITVIFAGAAQSYAAPAGGNSYAGRK